MIFHTTSTRVMSAPLLINIFIISGSLKAAKCNAVQPPCSNKTKKHYIQNVHYTDKFQLNLLVTQFIHKFNDFI